MEKDSPEAISIPLLVAANADTSCVLHSQAQEESHAGQVGVALGVELASVEVGLCSGIAHALVVSHRLAFLRDLEHSLDSIDEEDADKDECNLQCILDLGHDCSADESK